MEEAEKEVEAAEEEEKEEKETEETAEQRKNFLTSGGPTKPTDRECTSRKCSTRQIALRRAKVAVDPERRESGLTRLQGRGC